MKCCWASRVGQVLGAKPKFLSKSDRRRHEDRKADPEGRWGLFREQAFRGRGVAHVRPLATKKFVFRFTLDGRVTETGLGSLDATSRAEAREAALGARKLVKWSFRPVAARRAKLQETQAARAVEMTPADRPRRSLRWRRTVSVWRKAPP